MRPYASLFLGISLLAFGLAPRSAAAKDLRQRVAVGFDTQLGGMPTLSARYGLPMPSPAINVQVEGDIGMDFNATAADRFFGGGRVLYGIVAEDNLNLYGTAGAGVITGSNSTTVRLQPGMAVDFFFFGLENLGFTASWGLNLDVGDAGGVATTGSAGAGVHYWF